MKDKKITIENLGKENLDVFNIYKKVEKMSGGQLGADLHEAHAKNTAYKNNAKLYLEQNTDVFSPVSQLLEEQGEHELKTLYYAVKSGKVDKAISAGALPNFVNKECLINAIMEMSSFDSPEKGGIEHGRHMFEQVTDTLVEAHWNKHMSEKTFEK